MDNKVVKVKIIKVPNETYWYADKIGEIFEVVDTFATTGGLYYYLNVDFKHCGIMAENCEIVKEHEKETYVEVGDQVQALVDDAYGLKKHKIYTVAFCNGNSIFKLEGMEGNWTAPLEQYNFFILHKKKKDIQPTNPLESKESIITKFDRIKNIKLNSKKKKQKFTIPEWEK